MKIFKLVPPGKKGIAVAILAELLLGAALAFSGRYAWHATNNAINELSELADPSPYRGALLGHLGKIHVGLQGFLRSADPALSELSAKGLIEFEGALQDFQNQSARLFPQAAVAEIRRSFEGYRQAVTHTLEANTHRQVVRTKIDQNFAQILSGIVDQIRPLIREAQPDWEDRRDAALNIENQARAWQQNLAKAWQEASSPAAAAAYENDSRGSFYIEQYLRLQLLARERKMVKQVKTVWQDNSDSGRKSLVHEKLVQEAEDFLDAQRGLVVNSLNKYLPAMSPADLEKRKSRHVLTMRLLGTLVVMLGVLGLVSIYFFVGALGTAIRGSHPAPQKPVGEPGPMIKMNLKGIITGWSSEAEALYGYASDDILGEAISTLFESSDDVNQLSKDLLVALKTSFDSMHKSKNGTLFHVKIDFHPITDSAGKVTAINLHCTKK